MLQKSKSQALNPVLSVAGICFHGVMLFVLPFIVGGIAGAFLEVSEVSETLSSLSLVAFVCIAPIFLAQCVGVFAKTRREVRFMQERGTVSLTEVLDATYRNTRLLTSRGYFVFFSGVLFVLLALAYRWASLGVMAVASLLLFYITTGASVFLSAFLVRTFESGMGRHEAGIRREFHPAVARNGQTVEERFHLTKVPILPGYFLAIEDRLPARLDTDVRHVIPPRAARETMTVKSVVRRTPRGTYEAGPARIWYQDLLGLTRINVASLATARVKVLPKLSRVEIIDPPRTPLEEPDILTQRHKFPTEDFFRFREYHAGDDTRRIHWKLSMRVGQLQLRLPEAREITTNKVVLTLDTFVPTEWLQRVAVIDDLMDALVDVWISTADRLIKEGEQVTMVAALRGNDGKVRRESIDCGRGQRPQWLDAGARAMWQDKIDTFDLFEEDDTPEDAFMVVLTSRLEVTPPDPLPGRRTTWVYLHPADTIGPEPPSPFQLWLDWQDKGQMTDMEKVLRFLQLPHPAGSDENALIKRLLAFNERLDRRDMRAFIRRHVVKAGERSFAALLERPDVVYRMQVNPGHYTLLGVSNGGGGARREVPDNGVTTSSTSGASTATPRGDDASKPFDYAR